MDKEQSKIIVKDVKHLLSKGKRVQLVSKNIFSVPKRGLGKMKDWFKKKKDSLKKSVNDKKGQLKDHVSDVIVTKKANKLGPIASKLEAMEEVYNKYTNYDEYTIEAGSKEAAYLEALHDRIKKLSDKKIKVEKKNYGVFWMSRKALKKLVKSKINKEDTEKTKVPKEKKARKDKDSKKGSISEALSGLQKLIGQQNSAINLLVARISSLEDTVKSVSDENARLREEMQQMRMAMGMDNSSTMHK